MSGRFLTKLVAQKNDHDKWELVELLVYEDDMTGRQITVPTGFRTDYASVPRLPIIYLVDGNCGHEAAVVHDYLYYTGAYPRAVADAVFREALFACGESSFRAWSMWLGVRVGGWKAWNNYRRAEHEKISEQ